MSGLAAAAVPPLPTVMVVPTGVGCAIGGFAGDALPAARLLAAASGCLITHPNVMNAAVLSWSDRRLHYLEGWSLNRFAAGELALAPVASRRVGLLLDAGIEAELRTRHLQVADACRASLGLSIGPVVTTEAPLGVSLRLGPSGTSWGSLERPEVLLRSGERLVAAGATAIAVVARFPDDPGSGALAAYRHGEGVDALAGAEAVISHLLSRHLGLPCAHAPALAPLPIDPGLDPRAAAEELGHTFLPCVLTGLSRAPDLVPLPPAATAAAAAGSAVGTSGAGHTAASALQGCLEGVRGADGVVAGAPCLDPRLLQPDLIHPRRLGALVAPAGALGGEAVLACAERGVPVIAVRRNPCLLEVDAAALGLAVLEVESYAEAAGVVLALREGIDPGALGRPLASLSC